MPSREYHESLWASVPPGLEPARFRARLRFLLEHLRAGDRVLDLGCGEGRFAIELHRDGIEVVAVDVAEEPLRRARAQHPELEVRLIDGEGPWELPDASFDAVWAGEVIEHVADTSAWLSELRRVLRPHGRLLLSTPAYGPPELLRLALSSSERARQLDPRGEHLRFLTRPALAALLADFGFEEIEIATLGSPLRGGRTLLLAAVRKRF